MPQTLEKVKVNPVIFDEDPDYFPLYNGLKPSSMGLLKNNDKTFIFGNSFSTFRKNKELCREERLSKYYRHTNKKYPEITKYIFGKLRDDYPEHFKVKYANNIAFMQCELTGDRLAFNLDGSLNKEYTHTDLKVPFVDAFDALAMQVAEDLVIHDYGKKNRDFASYIHLCACNGWNAEWAIGRSFDWIHRGVPRIKEIIPNTIKMLAFIATKIFSMERIAAISFKTSPILNRHVDDQDEWDIPFNPDDPFLNIRVERQTVKGFRKSNAFLFTIRTFLYDANSTDDKRKKAVIDVFENPPKKSYAYEVIIKLRKGVLKWLA